MRKRIRSYRDVVNRLQNIAKKSPHISLILLGTIHCFSNNFYPFYMIRIGPKHSRLTAPTKKISLTAGTHGNEPAGVEAILTFLEQNREADFIQDRLQMVILPCINPYGYEYNTRENHEKIDLNRKFRASKPPMEVTLSRRGLGTKPFDLSLEFHEDIDSQGFYLYEISPAGKKGWGRDMIRSIAQHYPINNNTRIDGFISKRGIISPQKNTPNFAALVQKNRAWPQALFHFSRGTPRCITTETPVHFPLKERVKMHLMVMDTIFRHLKNQKNSPL